MIRQEITYHPNTHIIKEYKEYSHDNLIVHEIYNEQEQLISIKTHLEERNYHQGQLHGEQIEYHDNGTPKTKRNYIDGVLHGKTIYYESGQIFTECDYFNNQQVEVKVYLPNGERYNIEYLMLTK
jgi:antitoxin component YwqK of YwqJK toxin-antitoxin module